MIMYQTVKWASTITEREVLRTTDKFVYVKTARGEDRQAIEYLRDRYKSAIEHAKKAIADAEMNLKELDQLKN